MIKFTKIKNSDNPYERSNIEFSIDDSSIKLKDLLEEFQCFLKAVGYQFNLNDEIMLVKAEDKVKDEFVEDEFVDLVSDNLCIRNCASRKRYENE